MRIRHIFTLIIGFVLTSHILSAQQKFTVEKVQVDLFFRHGYIDKYAHERFSNEFQTGKKISIFSLLYEIKGWKPGKYEKADEETMVFPNLFINGALTELNNASLLSKHNFLKMKEMLETGKVKGSNEFEYLTLLQCLIWKEYLDSKEHLKYIISQFQLQELIAQETASILLKKNQSGDLSFAEIVKSVNRFKLLEVRNENMEIDAAIMLLNQILGDEIPGLKMQKNECRIDSSYLYDGGWFEKDNHYYSIDDSTEFFPGRFCNCTITVDTIVYSHTIYLPTQTYQADSLNVWHTLNSRDFPKMLNQIIVDRGHSPNFTFMNLSQAGMSAHYAADDRGLFVKFPEMRVLEPFIPVVYHGNVEDIYEMERVEDKLKMINHVASDYWNEFSFLLKRNIYDVALVPLSEKRAIARLLMEQNMIDTSGNRVSAIVKEIESRFYNSTFDILNHYSVRSLKADIAQTVLFTSKFDGKNSPVYSIFRYFDWITGRQFKPANVIQQKESDRIVSITFDVYGETHKISVNTSLNEPLGYLQMFKSVFQIVQGQHLFTDCKPYYITRFVNTQHNTIIFVMPESAARKLAALLGGWVSVIN